MASKVIVITGASSGIGAALAPVLVQRGHRVVLAARRHEALDAVAAPLGDHAMAIVTDVTKRADNERLRDGALARFGQIDTWIANAGRGITKLPSQLTDDEIDEMILVNVKSVLYGFQAVLPHMKERKSGHLIAVSSMLGKLAMAPFRSIYSASKAAVNSLVASLRGELRAEFPGIMASAFMPGVVATPFGSNALHGGVDSRVIPNAQPVEEVAVAIADLVATPRPEAYSRPGMLQMAAQYYAAEDLSDVESKPPFAFPQR